MDVLFKELLLEQYKRVTDNVIKSNDEETRLINLGKAIAYSDVIWQLNNYKQPSTKERIGFTT